MYFGFASEPVKELNVFSQTGTMLMSLCLLWPICGFLICIVAQFYIHFTASTPSTWKLDSHTSDLCIHNYCVLTNIIFFSYLNSCFCSNVIDCKLYIALLGDLYLYLWMEKRSIKEKISVFFLPSFSSWHDVRDHHGSWVETVVRANILPFEEFKLYSVS